MNNIYAIIFDLDGVICSTDRYLSSMTPGDLSREVRMTLHTLRRRGYLLAIGSSSKNTRQILSQLGLGEFFDLN